MQDTNYVHGWNVVAQNQHLLKDWRHRDQFEKDTFKYVLWNCRFCNERNLVPKKQLIFAPNKTKEVLKEGNQEKPEGALLLFVVDNSSSMEETFAKEKMDPEKRAAYEAIQQQLEKKAIYKKIREKEETVLKGLRKSFSAEDEPYKDLLSKNKVLMSLAQEAVEKIKSEEKDKNKKIGFVFFNTDIIAEKVVGKKSTTIKIQEPTFSSDHSTETRVKVNFNNYKELYSVGKDIGHGYGSDMKQFKFEDLDIMAEPTGQTALGPAMFVAAGIASNYGPGSTIVVVTDGQSNKGVLSEEQAYEDELKFLRMQLKRIKCQTCLIQLSKVEEDTAVQQFYRRYEYERKDVDLTDKADIEKFTETLKRIVDNAYNGKTWMNELRVKCQHSAIDYEQSVRTIRVKLFNENQQEYLTPKFNEKALKPQDYLYPFMTQIVIKYQNIETKQEEVFMTYMVQKFIRYSQMAKTQKAVLNSQRTLENVLTYLSVEKNKLDFEDIPLSVIQKSFRESIERSFALSIDKNYQFKEEEEKILPQMWHIEQEVRADSDDDKL